MEWMLATRESDAGVFWAFCSSVVKTESIHPGGSESLELRGVTAVSIRDELRVQEPQKTPKHLSTSKDVQK